MSADAVAAGAGDVRAGVGVAGRGGAVGGAVEAGAGVARGGAGGGGRAARVGAGRGRVQRAVARDSARVRGRVGGQARRRGGRLAGRAAQPRAAAQRGRHGARGARRARLQPRQDTRAPRRRPPAAARLMRPCALRTVRGRRNGERRERPNSIGSTVARVRSRDRWTILYGLKKLLPPRG